MVNTPPTYAMYIAGLVFEWLLAQGGVAAIEQKNIAKAALLYDYLDTTEFYRSPARKADRSRMNVCFHLRDKAQDAAFLEGAKARRHGSAEGPSRGRRHARVDLQRDADRRRAGAGRLHEDVRAAVRLMATPLRILTLNQIASQGLDRFPASRYVVGKNVDDPDAIVVRSHDLHAMALGPRVKAIGRAGAGTNNIPVAEMSRRGVPVFNAPGANANAVKELVLCALLLATRNVRAGASLRRKASPAAAAISSAPSRKARSSLPASSCRSRTLGIVGLGAIGSLVADIALKLGMEVIGFDPEITVDAAWRLPSSVRRAHSVEELLKQSDFVTLHVPLLPVTRHLIDAPRLAAMKPGAVLLNFAREALVDEEAVLAALQAQRLKYYLCDFPSARLIGEPGFVALPHLGASTEEAEVNSAVMVVDQVRAYLEHGAIRNAVNFPNVDMPRESPYRVAIANANVPNMLGQISTAMGHAGLNIHNMVNKSRGEMAYTLVDVDSPVSDAAVVARGGDRRRAVRARDSRRVLTRCAAALGSAPAPTR